MNANANQPQSPNPRSNVSLKLGNCLDVLKEIPDSSIDSIVTDPPYGLSFMGKRWDYDVPSVEVWAECLRVLKPGGHLLAFAGTRTQHRMAVRIEDAGFEIRDMIAWVYGQGFPKSHNISKSLSDCACTCAGRALPYTNEEGLSRKSQAQRPVRVVRDGYVSQALDPGQGGGPLLQPCLQEQSASCDRLLPEQGEQGGAQPCMARRSDPVQKEGELHRSDLRSGAGMGATDGEEGRLCDAAPTGYGADLRLSVDPERGSGSPRSQPEQQRPVEPCALSEQRGSQAWGGWPVCGGCGKSMVAEGLGTSLKPALEPITVARKPLEGTVAANVLAHGTGALNVDGCRVEHVTVSDGNLALNPHLRSHINGGNGGHIISTEIERRMVTPHASGRWPANIIHDGSDEVTGLFPQTSSGVMKAGQQRKASKGKGGYCDGFPDEATDSDTYGDSGSAARFFYCAKANKKERGEGNTHPTVKPIKLMEYLCRLVTPPGGVVLDPFLGSGSTGIAAVNEGFDFIGIEMEESYLDIANQRINGVLND